MFEPVSGPRIFGVPPGADFPKELVYQLLNYYQNDPPENLARVRILVNTRRMQRRLRDLFCQSRPLLLPRIDLVTDFDRLLAGGDLPVAVTPLRRQLEMTRLVTQRIESDRHAPKSAAVDLAESLSFLLDELHGEAVSPSMLSELKVEDESGYWERGLAFLNIVKTYVDAVSDRGVDGESRRRSAANLLVQKWSETPPSDPVIIAGSTGSRGTTSLLMEAVAQLPKGAVVLPGFDFDLPEDVWHDLARARLLEDHPQYRFAAFLSKINVSHGNVRSLGKAPDPARNKLISLSLRPAKVTDQWLSEGPELGNLKKATSGLALLEAASPREESLAIAVALKQAIHDGKKVALITPDGTLGRRVAAALARWHIRPDESAGVPLSLTPPGRFLRQVANMIGGPVSPDALLALLKHPLCRTGSADRGPHLLHTNALEIACRKKYVAEVTQATLGSLAKDASEDRTAWCAWIGGLLEQISLTPNSNLEACLTHHIIVAEAFSSGPNGGTGLLWEKDDGADVRGQIDMFRREMDFPAPISFTEYARLLERVLMSESSRAQEGVRPDVMIWGTLEARVQGADLVILGGLNEGIWPEQPSPDPWLSRKMRRELGLLLPEREIGLSAHDYQQAIAAKEVILSRSKRNDDSETVPSRWLNRLINLLMGLNKNHGPEALVAMRARGARLVEIASTFDPPLDVEPAKRPAPAPPKTVRPRKLSVTGVRTLVRDPYAVYAQRILKLEPLSPIAPQADARLKGIVFHSIMEELFRPEAETVTPSRVRDVARKHLANLVPWPHVRTHWMGHVDEITEQLMALQVEWAVNTVLKVEAKGLFNVPNTTFVVSGKADRIDMTAAGTLLIYDYKTGVLPPKKDVISFDRQLLIEAVMAEAGAFEGVPASPVDEVFHVSIGRSPQQGPLKLGKDYDTVTISAELANLLISYDNDHQGYSSRRIMENARFDGDFDHLARFGEWDATFPSEPEPVK